MTLAADPVALDRAPSRLGTLAVAGMASIGAGAIHAAAIGAHAEHRAAVWTFTVLAAVQLGWGVLALWSSRRLLALGGIALGAAAVVGWVVAKTSGLPISGLDVAEDPQLADTAAAALALVSLVVAVAAAVDLRREKTGPNRLLAGGAAVAVLAASFTGMVAAGSHAHAGGHDDGHAHGTETVTAAEPVSAVAAKPFKVGEPIDLGGVPGVTPQQQAAAENLLTITLMRLPQWSDWKVAEAHGFHTIGDGFTGTEHFINSEYRKDATILDPDHPEALVYDTHVAGQRKLVAAMYMLPEGATLDDVPELGGALTQWHIHNNLCFTPDPVAPRVAGLTLADGTCRAPLVKGPEQPMIHVWIDDSVPIVQQCGPFTALEGIGGGQVKAGESVACDHAHAH